MKRWPELTIVTSCTQYGKYLRDWAASILNGTMWPGAVRIFSHGSVTDYDAAESCRALFRKMGVDCVHEHSPDTLDLGVARNRAVAMSSTEWVMHLDADDTLTRTGLEACFAVDPSVCDVIQAGYERSGNIAQGPVRRARLYVGADGLAALDLPAICSGNSPFRRSLWAQAPYREDMLGAWDTALWIGFARLGARFRPSTQTVFYYRHHRDSVFNTRRKVNGWARAHTSAMLKALRRQYAGVDVIIPKMRQLAGDQAISLRRVSAHYAVHHPSWGLIHAECPTPEWIKGAAIAQALDASRAKILVLANPDCLVEPEALDAAVHAVEHGAAWAMPHTKVYRANAPLTAVICNSPSMAVPAIPATVQCESTPFDCPEGIGIVVLRRVDYDAIGGVPSAFRGWGAEDRALALLANTLLGPCVRGTGSLIHLSHSHVIFHAPSKNNTELLRKMGYAALHGKDTLVSLTASLPYSSARPNRLHVASDAHHTAVREIKQFDQREIAARRERLQTKRRRMQ
jgi:hypothetical protein